MATTSYSQSSCYISCPAHWKFKYVDKWEFPEQGASLNFGSAFDSGVIAILEKNNNYIDIFNQKWFSTSNRKNEIIPIFDNPNITYSYNDFDEYTLKTEDLDTLDIWTKELNLTKIADNSIEIFKIISKNKKNPYKHPSENQIKYFNRVSWLCLKRKGEILLEAFKTQFLPQVDEVLAIQKYAYLKDEITGDAITGYIDFVLRMKDRTKPVIFDLKTSANAYKQEQIDNTDQLTLYAAIEGKNFNTTDVGYVVCVKNIKKITIAYCKICGNKKTSQHKTCDVIVNNKRCSGEWDFKIELEPEIQVMIESKSEKQMVDILIDQGNIIEAMNNQIVYKNTSKCNNWYGQKCPYYNLCYNNDSTGLKKKGT